MVRNPRHFAQRLFIHDLCCMLGLTFAGARSNDTFVLCIYVFACNNILNSCPTGGVMTVVPCSGKDFNPVSFEGGNFSFHRAE